MQQRVLLFRVVGVCARSPAEMKSAQEERKGREGKEGGNSIVDVRGVVFASCRGPGLSGRCLGLFFI